MGIVNLLKFSVKIWHILGFNIMERNLKKKKKKEELQF